MGQAMNLEYLPRTSYGDRVLRLPVGREGYEGQQHIDCTGRRPTTSSLTLTKALGDSSTAETWTSPNFEIDRP